MTEIHSEVCVDSGSGAFAAFEAGAHRIELCQELAVGGLTPSAGLLRSACRLGIDVVVLIRPRAGDFVYDESEVATMTEDIVMAREMGARGVAVGALTPDGRVDQDAMARWVDAAGDLPVCFHRAFDGVADPFEAMQVLGELRVARILTSGQRQNVVAGLSLLRRLVQASPVGLEIMPGGGVRAENAARVLRESGARSLHFSARTPMPPVVEYTNLACDLHDPARHARTTTSVEEIRRYLDAMRQV
ncbi:MAG: copper homeostasis protein CutC [Planctomycetes bacterium]|nr:copper homeostasis protein CutC [Planctomycetota bacterium]MCB9910007.1 copper homeostasis protein CutC [Planctomycetota bacterium]HPF14225.1 copper homeostasis protein CutC [Planctomycetota bacterium]HRV81451.1 copper homeostasis protein CutC [Planctomycetota bacterium]